MATAGMKKVDPRVLDEVGLPAAPSGPVDPIAAASRASRPPPGPAPKSPVGPSARPPARRSVRRGLPAPALPQGGRAGEGAREAPRSEPLLSHP